METLTQKPEQIAPFLNETEIPIDREDIRLVLGLVTDPDVKQFAESHRAEMDSGNIRIDDLSRMTPREAVVYKILYKEAEDSEALAGLIYLSRKGMDPGTLEILYVLAQDYQDKKQGIATESVRAATEAFGKRFDLIANITDTNEKSIKLASKLGYAALGVDFGVPNLSFNPARDSLDAVSFYEPSTAYVRPRSSRQPKRAA